MNIPPLVTKPAFNITRASHVVHRVRDLKRSRSFYVDALGFLVSDEDENTLYLRGLEEACHHSIVLKRHVESGCERIGFRGFSEEDVEGVERHFRAAGLPTAWVKRPFQSRTLHVTDPTGAKLEFCASMNVMPRAVNQFGKHLGACPMRLDHFQILTQDVETGMKFYIGMGFRLSEFISNAAETEVKAAFLQRKGNPHDIVFMDAPGPRLHHAAFTCPEARNLMDACDILAAQGFGNCVEHGPGRHFGPGYARFLYLRDPDNHRIELFNNHYQTIDIEDEPFHWRGAPHGDPSRWGRPPVPSWREEASAFVDDSEAG